MNQGKQYDVIILGAGAAGLMCALTAGFGGLNVLVLEKSNKAGKKILMSGGGRCNFTNLNTSPENFLSTNPHFCKSALSQFTPWHFIEMVNQHQISYHEKELGQLFCDHTSKDILNMLMDECAEAQVEIRMNIESKEIRFGDSIEVRTDKTCFTAKHLVVATGGLSIPKMGGSDFGYQLANQLGLNIQPKHAGLVPFVFTDSYKGLFSELSGSTAAIAVSIPASKQTPVFQHQMLFTHRGLSGPSMLQISSYWQIGQTIAIDLLPGLNAFEALKSAKQQSPQNSLSNWLSQFLPNKVAQSILAFEFPKIYQQPLQRLNSDQIQKISNMLNGWVLKPSGTEGYRTAEVTLGGVDTTELSSKTMATVKNPNVYFIGEVVDVTGHLGGYNFQWAWASGFVCAQAMINNNQNSSADLISKKD